MSAILVYVVLFTFQQHIFGNFRMCEKYKRSILSVSLLKESRNSHISNVYKGNTSKL